MPVDVDELPIARGQLFDGPVHLVKVGSGNSRVDIQKIAGVITERGVVHRPEQDWPHGQGMQECIKPLCEALDASAAIGCKPCEKIVTANRNQRGRWSGHLDSFCLAG